VPNATASHKRKSPPPPPIRTTHIDVKLQLFYRDLPAKVQTWLDTHRLPLTASRKKETYVTAVRERALYDFHGYIQDMKNPHLVNLGAPNNTIFLLRPLLNGT